MDLSKIQTLLLSIFGIVIIIAAISLAAKSKKAQYSDTARTSVTVFAAIIIAGIGLGAITISTFGSKILTQLGVG